jgi:hypothetical protein
MKRASSSVLSRVAVIASLGWESSLSFAATALVRPRLLNMGAEYDHMKTKVAANAQPWYSTFSVTFLVLLSAMWLVPPASVHAQSSVNYTFEDGLLRGTPTRMQVPPRILTENGNKFMRITGSVGDCQSLPSSLCPPRNRSTVRFTTHYAYMPYITSTNMRQTYSARMRFHKTTGNDGIVFELFQWAPGGKGGYGNPADTGPVIIFWHNNGRVGGRANYAGGTKGTTWDLGPVAAGTWHTYMVKAVWSHDPSLARIEIYLDGVLKKRITGRDSNLGPTSNRLPEMKLGMYGSYAVGHIDVDNVRAGPSR